MGYEVDREYTEGLLLLRHSKKVGVLKFFSVVVLIGTVLSFLMMITVSIGSSLRVYLPNIMGG